MVIDITKKGIKETLGIGKRFQNLPRTLKELKLATIRKLPLIIKKAHIILKDSINIHGNAAEFAYFVIETEVNGVPVRVSLDVKRTSAKKFLLQKNYKKLKTRLVFLIQLCYTI